MKRIVKISLFLIFCMLMESGIGHWLSYEYKRSSDVKLMKLRHSWSLVRPEWLVLGSSRALHHYDVKAMQENLNWGDGYNAGMDGQGLIAAKLYLQNQLAAGTVKRIILDIAPGILTDMESDAKLGYVFPEIANQHDLRESLFQYLPLERISFMSSIYPYNSRIIDILFPKSSRMEEGNIQQNGFEPLVPTVPMREVKVIPDLSDQKVQALLKRNIEVIESIQALCAQYNVTCILVVSPLFKMDSIQRKVIQYVRDVAEVMDFSGIADDNPAFFNDNLHLNSLGAKMFSDSLTHQLKIRETP